MAKTRTKEIDETCFECMEEGYTIGKLKNPKLITKKWRRIGGFNVDKLRKLLAKLPRNEDVCVGIYVTRKTKSKRIIAGNLAPMHSKGYCLAPMLTYGDYKERQDRDEF